MLIRGVFNDPYSPYLLVSALAALVTALMTWQRRSSPGAAPLSIMLFTAFVWAGAYLMVLETPEPDLKILWFNVMHVGSLMGPPAFWAFGVQYTNRRNWLTPGKLLAVNFIPLLSILLCWTTDLHGLFYEARDLSGAQWNILLGPFYWVNIVYAYSLVLFALYLVAGTFARSSDMYKEQSALVLVGALIPFLGNIVYTFAVGFGKLESNPTPVLYSVTGIIYAYALFRRRLFDLVPIARDTLVEHMQDGVILIDSQNRIVDVNPSARRWLGWNDSSPIGDSIQGVLPSWYEKFSSIPPQIKIETEERLAEHPETYFDLRVEPLLDEKDALTGRLILFRDITRQKMVEQAFRDTLDRMKLHVKEIETLQDELREQAIRDPLTGLFNRRYLEETLERELARATRDGSSLSICMADIDDFKSFNDMYGHKAGDMILKSLAGVFTTYSRAGDVVCRYGGEEFLILMPGADLDITTRRAEDWRRVCEQAKIDYEDKSLSITLSFGVAVFPLQGRTSDEVLKLADDALYLSKNRGKNQVNVARH